MRLTGLARRYAGALFHTARDAGEIDQVESDLGLITYSLESIPRLSEALTHPLIPLDRKKEIASSVFEGQVRPLTLDFLGLIITKRRESIISQIEREYVRLANEHRNVITVQVTSAVPLTDAESQALKAKLERQTGKKADLELKEDPAIIGGVVVRIGDTVYDGSVRGYLEALRTRLLGRE